MAVAVMLGLSGPAAPQEKPTTAPLQEELSLYAGSKSCIECHGKFYRLWASSRHGLAMQPYTPEFARTFLTPQPQDLVIGRQRYRAVLGPQAEAVLRQAQQLESLSSRDRARLAAALQKLGNPELPPEK